MSTKRLKVSNFLCIQNADIEIKKITILIGPQAQGKSILAKLCYYFENISSIFKKCAFDNNNKRELDKELIGDFERRFQKSSWEESQFSIEYTTDNWWVKISKKENSKRNKISISYSEEILKDYRQIKKKTKSYEYENNHFEMMMSYKLVKLTENYINEKSKISDFYDRPLFIPASRSFFSTISNNTFSMLSENSNIDPFLVEFGRFIERVKDLTKMEQVSGGKYVKDLSAILGGTYKEKNGKGYISNKKYDVELKHSSSGQQEFFPLLAGLVQAKSSRLGKVFIEEPEAHLFPKSQSEVISFISRIRKEVFITTHSPYIITAINNLILYGTVLKEKTDSGDIDKAKEITRESDKFGSPIDKNEISAYTITKGKTQDIVSLEDDMIGADLLDDVSADFENFSNYLLSMEGGF